MKRKWWTLLKPLAVVFLLIVLAFTVKQVSSTPPSPEDELRAAWQQARASGAYDYHTTIIQTTWPLPKLENVGLSSKQHRLYLEGQTDLTSRFMQMRLWAEGGHAPTGQKGIEIRVDDGQAQGRVDGGEWQAVDNVTQIFAPDYDALTYLVAARNVVKAGQDSRAGILFTRYTFDVDGLAFAQYMRERMEAELQRTGKLPAGLSLDMNRQYVGMMGQGEIWVDQAGLPLRQIVQLQFPPGQLERMEAEVTTDFSAWGPAASPILGWISVPSRWLDGRGLAQAGWNLSLAVGALGLLMWMVFHSRSRPVYAALALAVIASMILTPLLQSQHVSAFYAEQQAGQAQLQAEQVNQEKLDQVKAQLSGARSEPARTPLPQSYALAASTPVTYTLDSDEDGLTDQQEAALGTSPVISDTDRDGLLDGIEVNELGIDPLDADTDGDLITDTLEVKGFIYTGKHWFLDPLNPDTNRDGQMDGGECFNLVSGASAICQDTDGDGTPDVLDFDNDNDGVPDTVDQAPSQAMGGGLVGGGANIAVTGFPTQTFFFQASGLTPGMPALVDFQLRPVNPKHLWYTLNVLDWPSDDRQGQQRRVFDNTFGDSGREANGDMRLVPMLEILIPAQEGFGGLPVKAGVSTRPPLPSLTGNNIISDTERLNDWLASWLDKSATDKYGMSVRVKDRTGALLVYAPLNLVRETAGDSPAAFAARVFYRPTDASLGPDQHIRLVWLVQGLQDSCKPVDPNFEPGKPEAERFDDWCRDAQNWETGSGVIHTYYDDWYLTGLDVQEYRGIDVGAVFENPQFAGRNPNYESNLWHLASLLETTFLAGQAITTTTASGQITVTHLTVDDIVARWSMTSTATLTQSWGITPTALQVIPLHFQEPGDLATIPMTHTKAILEQYFTADGQALVSAPTLLFVRQEYSRIALLDMPGAVQPGAGTISATGVYSGSSLIVDLTDVQEQTLAGMSWAPYRHLGAGVWEAYPIEEYWQSLDTPYGTEFTQLYPDDDELHNAGRVVLAKSLYLSRFHGATSLVAFDGEYIPSEPVAENIVVVEYAPAQSLGASVSSAVEAIGDILEAEGGFAKAGAAAKAGVAAQTASALASTVDVLAEFGVLQLDEAERGAVGTFGSLLGSLGNWTGWEVKTHTGLSNAYGAVVIGATVAAGTLMTLKLAGVEGEGLDVALEVVDYTSKAMAVVSSAQTLIKVGQTLSKDLQALKAGTAAVSKAAKVGAIIGLVITVGLAIGLFLYQVISAGLAFGSLAFDLLLAGLVATIIVAVIMFAIAMIPVIGALIVAIVGLIDAVIALICKATGLDKEEGAVKTWFCSGITGILTEIVKNLIYGQTPTVDIQNANRFKISQFKTVVGDDEMGYQQGNTLGVSLAVTNTLFRNNPSGLLGWAYLWQYGDTYLRESRFKYEYQLAESDIHDGLSTGSGPDPWKSPAPYGGTLYMTQTLNSLQLDSPIHLTRAGLNLPASLFLTEGYQINAQECIGVPVPVVPPFIWIIIPVCWLRDTGDSLHTPLGEQLVFDILPASLDEFYTLTARENGGYALAWDERFPSLADADGDGLRSRAVGGNDPDDSQADTDADGLSDFFEIQTGTNPTNPDMDGDGLEDYWELFYATNPHRRDSDGDGLSDKEELDGWSFVYDFDNENRPLSTWVSSDPLRADTDGDGITDKLESVYGFNPRAWSELNVIRVASGVLEPGPSGLTPSDGFAAPGQSLYYTATVENKLTGRYADGLLEVEFPAAVQGSNLVPQPFSLAPYNPGWSYNRQDLVGNITVTAGISRTQALTLTNRAGALIASGDSASARVLWLHLNDDAYTPGVPIADESHKENLVTCQSPYCPTPGTAYAYFDGLANYITAQGPALNLYDDAGFTEAVWIYPQSQDAAYRGILGYPPNRGRFDSYPGLWVYSSTNIYAGFGDGEQWNAITTTGDVLVQNQWNHVIATFDGITYRLYVNGSEITSTQQFSGSIPYPNTRLDIGRVDTHFKGRIKEVEIYPRALTEQEILDFYGYALLLHMPFEAAEPYKDNSFHHQPTTVISPPDITDIPPQGSVASFTQTQWLGVGPGPSLDLSDADGFSLAAWLRPLPRTASPYKLTVMGSRDDAAYPSLFTDGTTLTATVRTSSGTCTAAAGGIVSPTTSWHHVLASFRVGQGFVFYVDGVERYNQARDDELFPSACAVRPVTDDQFYIGRESASSPELYYQGYLDELRVYSDILESREAEMLSGGQALWLRFDEPPGSSWFHNSASSAVLVNPCSLAAGTCPISGMPGRMEQAVHFDGETDYIRASGFELRDRWLGFTESAWVWPEMQDDQEHGILGYDGSAGQVYPSLWVTASRKLKAGFWPEGGSTWCEFSTLDDVLTPYTWNHVAATFDGATYTLYVNGIVVGQTDQCASKRPLASTTVEIGRVGDDYFQGRLDDVNIYATRALAWEEIQALMAEASPVYLRLDEPLKEWGGVTTTLFANTNPDPSIGPGQCSLNPGEPGQTVECLCPRAGAPGWMRQAAVFTGERKGLFDQCIQISDAQPSQSFSIGGWFKPNRRMPGNADQYLFVKDESFELKIPPQSMTATFSIYNVAQGGLIEDQWNHIFATYDGATGGASVYVNGALQGQDKITITANTEPIHIARGFVGLVDEVVKYDYALTEREINRLYQYQVRWFDTTDEHKIIIDADQPTARLDYALAYIGQVQGQVMVITATDKTSGVGLVEYRITGDRQDGQWHAALQDRAAWMFAITTTHGTYTIDVRATDKVGNQSSLSHAIQAGKVRQASLDAQVSSASTTLIVDSDPPTAALDSALIGAVLQPDPAHGNSLPLGGTVADPASGVAGLDVAILTPAGVIVGGIVTSSIAGGAWSADYIFPAGANGTYAVQLVTWDRLGNTGVITDAGSIHVDATPPLADVTYTGPSTQTVSGLGSHRPTILGTADETPYPTGSSLRLHLEEEQGAIRFYDGSTQHWVGTCPAGCPATGLPGVAGQAARFDGSQEILVPISNSLNVEDTLMAWVKPDWVPAGTGDHPVVLAVRSASVTRFSLHIQRDYAGVALWNGAGYTTFPASLTRGQWQHLAVVVAQGQASAYLNGTLLGAPQPFTPGNAHGLPLHVGSADGALAFFAGEIDEVALYDRALPPEQIYAIAHPASSGVSQVEIGFLHAQDRHNPESITWAPVSLDQPGQAFSTWSYPTPAGLEGPYQVYLRVTDGLSNTRILPNVWQGEIDTLAPRATFINRPVQIGGQTWYEVQCSAQDYNLWEDSFICPNAAIPEPGYQNAAWFLEIYTGTQKLYSLATPSVFLTSPVSSMSACDLFNNCLTLPTYQEIYLPLIIKSSSSQVDQAAASGPELPQPQPGFSLILTPTAGTVFTSLDPIRIAGYARTPTLLGALQVSANGHPIQANDWAGSSLSQSLWAVTWTPPAEGAYTLQAIVSDQTGNTVPGLDGLFYVDMTPPELDLETERITGQDWINGGSFHLRGLINEAGGLRRLQARVVRAGGPPALANTWQDLPIPRPSSGAWQGNVYSGLVRPPAGEFITVFIRAIDVAGRVTEITRTLWADATPAPGSP